MNKKYIFIGIGIVLLLVILFFIFFNKATLVINPSPRENSTVTIQGNIVTAGEILKLKPGTYSVKIELADYIPYEKEIKLGFAGNKTLGVNLRPYPIPQKVVPYQAKFTTLSSDKKSLFYLSNEGKTMYFIEDINAQPLNIRAVSPDFFSQVTDIIWSPDRELAIIKQGDATSLYDFGRYDLLHQQIYPFSDGIKDIVWRSDGEKLLYHYAPSGGETTLIEANKDSTNPQRIYNFKDTAIRNPKIDWAKNQKDVLILENSKLYLYNYYAGNLKPILENSLINDALFTPDDQVIYLTGDGIHICDKNGENDKKFDFNTKLDKITFIDNNNLVLVENSSLILYNLANNTKTILVSNPKYQINPVNVFLSPNKQKLYFESGGYLYWIGVDTGRY